MSKLNEILSVDGIRELKKRKITTIIFDLDGTLLNTLEDLTASVNVALSQFDFLPRTQDEVRSFIGNGIEKLMERAIEIEVNKELYKSILDAFREDYKKNCQVKTAPYDGVMDMLVQLKEKNISLGIVSNKADFAVKQLNQIFFKDLNLPALGESESQKKKPSPDMLFAVMKELNAKPEETLYVGDSQVDIQTAENANVTCISVTWGFKTEEFLREEGGKIMIHHPKELLHLV